MPVERDLGLVLPFEACKDCPLVEATTYRAQQHDIINNKNTPELLKVSIACAVVPNIQHIGSSSEIAYINGLAVFEVDGHLLNNTSGVAVGPPPEFCPQLPDSQK